MKTRHLRRVCWRTLTRLAWLTVALGLASGLELAAPRGAVQAQLQSETQTAEGGFVYQMPAGAAPAEAEPPEIFRPLIPGGDGALQQLKNQPATPVDRDGPATEGEPLPQAFVSGCSLNSANGATPSDIHGAVGLANIVAVTNRQVGIYNKNTCATVSLVTLSTFFGAFGIPSTQRLFDPRALYDPAIDRFIVTAESRDTINTDQFQYFAVSTDNTGTNWFLYRFVLSRVSDATLFCKQASGSFWDFPQVGSSSARWLMAANDFVGNTASGAILSIDKAASLAGGGVTGHCFPGLASNLAPPLVLDSSTTPFFLSPGSGSGNSITRYRLNQGAGTASDTLTMTTSIAITAWNAAADAPQPNGGQRLDVLDGRFQSYSIQKGTALWNVHTVAFGAAAARVYGLTTTGTSPVFTQTLFTGSSDSVFNASITVGNQAFVTATRTDVSAGAPAGNAAMLIFQLPSGGGLAMFDVIATSATQFLTENGVACNTASPPDKPRTSCRWGDYSATQIDPSNPETAWGFNQLVTGTEDFSWTTRGGSVVPPPPPPGAMCSLASQFGDFNGDGRDDLMFRRQSDGLLAEYQLNGFQVLAAQVLGAVGLEFTLAAVADFNGDGRADMLFRRQTDGMLSLYLMNGFQVVAAQFLGVVGLEWNLLGVRDFNGDGRADILFRRNSDGMLFLFLVNGFQIQAAQLLGIVGTEFALLGLGDFNGDGRSDMLFRRTTDGLLVEYQMNGFQILGAQALGTIGLEFTACYGQPPI